MNKNDVYIEISRVLEEHINKYGDSLHYVTFPYLDGQFFERIHVLTPIGRQVLQEYLDIRRKMETWEGFEHDTSMKPWAEVEQDVLDTLLQERTLPPEDKK